MVSCVVQPHLEMRILQMDLASLHLGRSPVALRSKAMPVVGNRIEITGVMPNDPCPLRVGDRGTVTRVEASVGQVIVDWDSSYDRQSAQRERGIAFRREPVP